MVRVCPYCSNIDLEKLKSEIGEDNVVKGCIGLCGVYKKESVGKIKGELVIKQTPEEFIEAIKNKLL